MNIEANRLNTFANWPTSTPVDPIRIAKAGFFYTGQGSEVQCFSCGGKVSDWNYGDQVMWRHRQMEPNCAFVMNPQLSGNVPLILGRDNSQNNSNSSRSSRNAESSEEGSSDEYGPNNYGILAMDELYQNDVLRLLSFSNWMDESVSRESLVNAGFYHAGEGRLRCAWCGGELNPFRCFGSLGPPLEVHRMYFPRCAHAILLESAQRQDVAPASLSPSLTPPLYSPPRNENVPQSSGAEHNARILSAGGTWRALGVVGGSARHPNYAAISTRLATYNNWPTNRTQTPKDLADAGFFYTGMDDQVRCFYCDGGLGKWESGDAPWSEHARWFPHCGYVLLVKGQEYIQNHRENQPPNTTTPESSVNDRRRNPGNNYPVTESQVDNHMESSIVIAALGAGLDAARVRRAIIRKLRATGASFSSSEGLIDAVLNDQLNETSWSAASSHRLATDILADTLRHFATQGYSTRSESNRSDSSSSSRSHSAERNTRSNRNTQLQRNAERESNNSNDHEIIRNNTGDQEISRTNASDQEISRNNTSDQEIIRNNTSDQEIIRNNDEIYQRSSRSSEREINQNASKKQERTNDIVSERENSEKTVSLEEENRQLKEARLCKVCMDSEVSAVFLPCGHLVSCAGCAAALPACPLCRCTVRALVRAYLA